MGRKAKLRAKRKALNFVRSDEINWAFVGDREQQHSCTAVAEVLHHMAHETICSDEIAFILENGVCLSVVWHRQKGDVKRYYSEIYFRRERWLESVACKASALDIPVFSMAEIVAVKVSATRPIEIGDIQDLTDFAGLSYRILPVLWSASPPLNDKQGSFVVAAQIDESVANRAFELSQSGYRGNPALGLINAVDQWLEAIYSVEMEIATRARMHRQPLAKNFATLRGQPLINYQASQSNLRIDQYV